MTEPTTDVDDLSENSEKGADQDEPPECVRWVDDETGVLEIEFTRPAIEWLDLEAAEEGIDVEEWARRKVLLALQDDLAMQHAPSVEFEVDLPEEFATRFGCQIADMESRGFDFDGAEVFNYLQFKPTYLLDGEPWPPLEGEEDGR